MEKATVKKSKGLSGEITVPGDKSISHRAVLMGAIAEGITEVRGFLRGEDTLNTLKACRRMGVAVEEAGDDLTIHGVGLQGLQEPQDVLDLGNSGTGMRLLAGLLAGQNFFSVMTGDSYLRQRPMARITRPLREMGARIMGRDDARLAPLAIQGGGLSPMVYHSPVSSAQVKSAILLAGLCTEGTTTVIEPCPSRDHTERMFRQFGCPVAQEGTTVSIDGGRRLAGREIQVPGDFSSAAFFIVAALCVPGSEILVHNVGTNPTRTGLLTILKRMGADIRVSAKVNGDEPLADIQIAASRLQGTEVSADEVPTTIDEFPILCVAAALAEGETRITGAAELRVKETDRIRAMTFNLTAVGAEVEELDDGLMIQGRETLKGGRCKSFGDHRIAMAMAVAGLCCSKGTTIEDTGCIGTSFPGFWETLDEVNR